MAAYVVMTPPGREAEADATILVRDGFRWLAFLVPVLWFAWHRMWLWASGFLVLDLAISVASGQTGWEAIAFAVGVLVNLWAGFEAASLLSGDLERRGWRMADVVVAPGVQAAEDIHFSNMAAAGAFDRPAPALSAGPARARPLPPRRDNDGPALGLFDHDGDR